VRRISAFISNLSVSWKFILAYYLVLIIPMAFFGVYFYRRAADNSISNAKLVMERNLLQTRSSILQKIALIENISQIITANDKVQTVFYYDYQNEHDRLRDYQFEVSPIIENACRQNSLIYAIRIYTPQTIISEMVGSYYSIRKKDSPQWYDEAVRAMPQKNGWISARDSMGNAVWGMSKTSEVVFSYSGSILSPVPASEVKIGLVEIEVRESVLFDMLRDPVTSKWGKIFVVDETGKIVSNNFPSLFHKNITELGFISYEAGSSVSKVEELQGIQSIIITTPIEDIGCSIVGIFPAGNFDNDVRDSLRNLLLILAVLSVFLGVVVYIVINVLLRRVKRLVKAMKQVKENNLSVSVPVHSMDEFGELALNFNNMINRIHELVETVYKIQLMERDAELKALEAQINPHFLYNSLATISWAARKNGANEIVRISNSLAKFYRLVLSKGGRIITVKDEIDMVRSYLEVQKIRFREMFDAVFRLDEDAMESKVLKNLLQPLVENALNHGIEPKRAHGTLVISVERRQEYLVLQVIDDGVGMDGRTLAEVMAGQVERTAGGYAVKNIMERLKAYYNNGHKFEVFSRPGIGSQFIITIRLEG